MPAVGLRSLVKRRGGREVLRGITLDLEPGEWLALLGPSGSGKTTLLRLVAGLEAPDSGDVCFDGRDMAAVAPRDRRVGMVFQETALWPALSVEEHLRETARGADVAGLLRRFELALLAARRPAELSGGERQRVALARSFAHEPFLLLLDEPFAHLDPLLRRGLAAATADLHRERGLTTICVSHSVDAAVARASRVALLREGRIEQCGTLAELQAAPANEWVAAFLAEEEGIRA